jgi:succinyl-CoA synthetase beta subunit
MQVLECDANKLLARYEIATPPGIVATTPAEAETAAMRLGPDPVFVKAQIRAGDRLAAGGVRAAHSQAAARTIAQELLGRPLATAQTGPSGDIVSKVLVERAVAPVRSFYVALSLDLAAAAIMLTAAPSAADGAPPDPSGLRHLRLGLAADRHEILAFCTALGLAPAEAASLRDQLARLHQAFVELDASLLEVNPLVLTAAGEWIALDAKLTTDDNAAFRHSEFAELDNKGDVERVELHAQRHQINFVPMDGDIGIVCNGAGLGLATVDMVRAAGGAPANFMDIRTTAKSLDIAQGIKLVLDNPRAKVLLVNVYGGGMQPCDTIVEGLGIAYRRSARALPIVLRVTGNNEDLARLRLANFKLPSTECADMWQAVTRAVAVAQGRA